MCKRMVVIALCSAFSLNALDIDHQSAKLLDTAYTLSQETYLDLKPREKFDYAQALSLAIHDGQKSEKEIIDLVNPSLRYDTARCYYLLYGKIIDLDTVKIAFPLRTLIQHHRLERTVTPDGNLDLSNLHIADLDGIDEIPNISSVRSLNLSHNEISLLHPSNFKALNQIKSLDLSFNKLATMKPKIFEPLSNLHELSLKHNHITNFDHDTFFGLTKLKKLDASHNILEWLGIDAFNSLSHLQSLNLSNNHLQLISPRVLDPLTHVKTFNISHNNFKLIHDHILNPMKQLEHLDMSNNQLTRVTDDTLHGLKKLKFLNLGNNKLIILDMKVAQTASDLKENVAITVPQLKAIVLGNNPIKTQRLTALRKEMPHVKILKNDPYAR